MKKFLFGLFVLGTMGMPVFAFAAPLTIAQANSLIGVVQSSPGTPASAFTDLITAFSNITVAQANSLIGVVQAAPGVAPDAFVGLLIAFTQDTPAPATNPPAQPLPQNTQPAGSAVPNGVQSTQATTTSSITSTTTTMTAITYSGTVVASIATKNAFGDPLPQPNPKTIIHPSAAGPKIAFLTITNNRNEDVILEHDPNASLQVVLNELPDFTPSIQATCIGPACSPSGPITGQGGTYQVIKAGMAAQVDISILGSGWIPAVPDKKINLSISGLTVRGASSNEEISVAGFPLDLGVQTVASE